MKKLILVVGVLLLFASKADFCRYKTGKVKIGKLKA